VSHLAAKAKTLQPLWTCGSGTHSANTLSTSSFARIHLCGNGNLNLDTSLDVDDDLLDDLGGGVQVDQALVDSHLVHVPGLGTLTTRSLAGGDLEVLGRETDGALDAQLLALGALDQLGADLLERGDLAGSQGDADLVDLGRIVLLGLLGVVRHGRDGVFLGCLWAGVLCCPASPTTTRVWDLTRQSRERCLL